MRIIWIYAKRTQIPTKVRDRITVYYLIKDVIMLQADIRHMCVIRARWTEPDESLFLSFLLSLLCLSHSIFIHTIRKIYVYGAAERRKSSIMPKLTDWFASSRSLNFFLFVPFCFSSKSTVFVCAYFCFFLSATQNYSTQSIGQS